MRRRGISRGCGRRTGADRPATPRAVGVPRQNRKPGPRLDGVAEGTDSGQTKTACPSFRSPREMSHRRLNFTERDGPASPGVLSAGGSLVANRRLHRLLFVYTHLLTLPLPASAVSTLGVSWHDAPDEEGASPCSLRYRLRDQRPWGYRPDSEGVRPGARCHSHAPPRRPARAAPPVSREARRVSGGAAGSLRRAAVRQVGAAGPGAAVHQRPFARDEVRLGPAASQDRDARAGRAKQTGSATGRRLMASAATPGSRRRSPDQAPRACGTWPRPSNRTPAPPPAQ